MTDYHPNRLYNHRSYYYRSVVLLFRTNTENIITNINYYVLFVSRTVLLPIIYITDMYILPNWLSPICTITELSYPGMVSLPNGTITELSITELFHYGLLLPNVAHSIFILDTKSSSQSPISSCDHQRGWSFYRRWI